MQHQASCVRCGTIQKLPDRYAQYGDCCPKEDIERLRRLDLKQNSNGDWMCDECIYTLRVASTLNALRGT